MKTIGMLGGMSCESTVPYYRILNAEVKKALGGLHSAKIVMYSVDFDELESRMRAGKWEEITEILTDAAKRVQGAGADFVMICTNTMHKVAPQIEAQLNVPLLHIADATADTLLADGITTVGLLGTRFTMEEGFVKDRLAARGLQVLVPEQEQRIELSRIAFEELCDGKLIPASKQYFLDEIDKLAAQGAQAIILGCTEIGLAVKQEDTDVPLYDTTVMHAKRAAKMALE